MASDTVFFSFTMATYYPFVVKTNPVPLTADAETHVSICMSRGASSGLQPYWPMVPTCELSFSPVAGLPPYLPILSVAPGGLETQQMLLSFFFSLAKLFILYASFKIYIFLPYSFFWLSLVKIDPSQHYWLLLEYIQ